MISTPFRLHHDYPRLGSHVRALLAHRGSRPHLSHRPVTCHATAPALQIRSKKTRSRLVLADLPQGLLAPLEPLQLDGDGQDLGPPAPAPSYPRVVQQARENMRKFHNCVLLTRVGGFYEMYFEHADEYGPLLNLKVAQKKTSAGPVSMAGFPFFQLDRYLKILVQDCNRYVAIAEEFPNEKLKAADLMHDRRVARVVTPGTLIDETFNDPFSNNYVLSIHVAPATGPANESEPVQLSVTTEVGLAWLDLSTGHFYTQSTRAGNLSAFLARITPTEIILNEDLRSLKDDPLLALNGEKHLLTLTPNFEVTPITEWSPMLESSMSESYMAEFSSEEISAGSSLLRYVEDRLLGSELKLQAPVRHVETMNIDKNTMRALEIKKTIRDETLTGSLLHAIRQTTTKGGARLLDSWLSSPSISLEQINTRLELVTHILEDDVLRERIITLLRRVHDSHRLLQKFAFGRGDPDDLIALAGTIHATRDIVAALQATNTPACVMNLLERIKLDEPMLLAERIHEAIDEDGVTEQHRIEDGKAGEMQALAHAIVASDGDIEDAKLLPKRKKRSFSIREHYADDNEAWIMHPRASDTLASLHEELVESTREKTDVVNKLSDELGVSSLTLRFSPSLGHICHVKGKDATTISKTDKVRAISSSKSTCSFHHRAWTTLAHRLDAIRSSIRREEQIIFHQLRQSVLYNLVVLRRNAATLDHLDVCTSFASVARSRQWTRPILDMSTNTTILGGRHPTVEAALAARGTSFTANDMVLSPAHGSSLHLITGPNMAGKSTYLRQNALITILAQIGSYVPAAHAAIGLVDAIFSRVGSADNLARDQSTFMVEMVETAAILRAATRRSFVIMDEVGRGTTPRDGEAVAFACVDALVRRVGCRALFATHFHGVVDLVRERDLDSVQFYCTDVQDLPDQHGGGVADASGPATTSGEAASEHLVPFRYVHKLREGVNRNSHALKVARLAGMPEETIAMAGSILAKSEARGD